MDMKCVSFLFFLLALFYQDAFSASLPFDDDDCEVENAADLMILVGDSRTTRYYGLATPSIAPGITRFIYGLLRQLDYEHIRAGIMAYSNTARIIAPFSNNFMFLNQQMRWWRPEYQGSQIYRGIYSARRYFRMRSQNSKKIVILLTDNCAENTQQTYEQANLARQENVTILTVGFSSQVNASELERISGDDDLIYQAASDAFLPSLIGDILNDICNVINGRRPMPAMAELIVILDDSESTRQFSNGEYIYSTMLDTFAKSIVVKLNLAACRIGMIMMSSTSRPLINLGAGIPELIQAAFSFKPEFLGTNPDIAYKSAITMFNELSEANLSTKKYVLLVTDGAPVDNSLTALETAKLSAEGVTLGLATFNTASGLTLTTNDENCYLQNSTWRLSLNEANSFALASEVANFVCPQ